MGATRAWRCSNVRGTNEDPNAGAHEDFLEEAMHAAACVRDFPVQASAREVCRFLSRNQVRTSRL